VVDNIAVRVSNGQGGSEEKTRTETRKAAPLPPAPQQKLDAQALDAGEELVKLPPATAKGADKPAEKAGAQAENRPAEAKAQGSGKYLVLIGAFSSEERARNWMTKLKEGKVPAYIERKVLADGERVLLRAGPFTDRGAADAAEKRVRAIGLTARVVEQ
jgi:DedD protein